MASNLNIVVHDEDGALWATVREMPGVFATGDTMDELRESLREGISLWLAEPGQDAPAIVLGELEKHQLLASASFAHA
jgi:predicted RNase H-like HicB family nuclease